MTDNRLHENLLEFLVAPLTPPSVEGSRAHGASPDSSDDRIKTLLEFATAEGVLPPTTVMLAFFHVLPEILTLDLRIHGRVRLGGPREGLLKSARAHGAQVNEHGISLWERAINRPDAEVGWIGIFSQAEADPDVHDVEHFDVVEVRGAQRDLNQEAWEDGWEHEWMLDREDHLSWSPPWDEPVLTDEKNELAGLLGDEDAAKTYVRWMAPLTYFGDVVIVAPQLHGTADHKLRLGGGGMVFVLERRGMTRAVLEQLYLVAHRVSLSTSEIHGVGHIATSEAQLETVKTITHTTTNVLRSLSGREAANKFLKNRNVAELKYELRKENGERAVQAEAELAEFLVDAPRVLGSALGAVLLARLSMCGGVVPSTYAAGETYELRGVLREAISMVNALALTRGMNRIEADLSGLPKVTFPPRYLHEDILRAILYELLMNASRHGRSESGDAGQGRTVHLDIGVRRLESGRGVALVVENACKHAPDMFESDQGNARLATRKGQDARRSYLMHMAGLMRSIGTSSKSAEPTLDLRSRALWRGEVSRFQSVLTLGDIIPSTSTGERATPVAPEGHDEPRETGKEDPSRA